jgi:hypothetical protein
MVFATEKAGDIAALERIPRFERLTPPAAVAGNAPRRMRG